MLEEECCSPPNTVIGIETYFFSICILEGFLVVALLIPSSVLKLLVNEYIEFSEVVVALLIPSSVLKLVDQRVKKVLFDGL